jgi:hypothetical protein
MRVSRIDSCVAIVVWSLVFLNAQHYASSSKALASCAINECFESTMQYYPQVTTDKFLFSKTTAWNARNPNPLGGTKQMHTTEMYTPNSNCTGGCNCANCPANLVFEGANVMNCTVVGTATNRWFCGTSQGVGVPGSWNE